MRLIYYKIIIIIGLPIFLSTLYPGTLYGLVLTGLPKLCSESSTEKPLPEHELRKGKIHVISATSAIFLSKEQDKKDIVATVAENVGRIGQDAQEKPKDSLWKNTPNDSFVIAQVRPIEGHALDRIVSCVTQHVESPAAPPLPPPEPPISDPAADWIKSKEDSLTTWLRIGSIIGPSDAHFKKYITELLERSQKIDDEKVKGKLPPIILSFLNHEEKRIKKNLPDSERKIYLEAIPNSYAAKKLLAQESVYDELQKHKKAKDFPFEEIWRFVIDGHKQTEGAYAFEDEPGYVRGALSGLAYALQTYTIDADANWYAKLHDTTVKDVQTNSMPVEGYDVPSYSVSYSFTPLDSDPVGIMDLQRRKRYGGKQKNVMSTYYLFYPNEYMSSTGNIVERKNLSDTLFRLTKQYLSGSRNRLERLMAYLWLARELEVNHLFADANGRSSNFALIAMIAKDKDLPMLMFEDPNVLDANGPEKLLVRALQGMENFLKNGKAKTYEKSKAKMSLSDQKFENAEIEKLRLELIKFIEGKTEWNYWHELMDPGSLAAGDS